MIYCWLWSLIFQIQRYYLVVIVTQEYCTLVPPALGFRETPRKRGFRGSAPKKMGVRGRSPQEFFLGCVLANSIANPWYWVSPRIFPLYFPYKIKHCKMTDYGIVLYWKRDCESVKRKCSSFAAGCIPSSFWTAIKGLANLFVDVAHCFGWTTLYLCLSVMFTVFLHLVYWFNYISIIALRSYFLTFESWCRVSLILRWILLRFYVITKVV